MIIKNALISVMQMKKVDGNKCYESCPSSERSKFGSTSVEFKDDTNDVIETATINKCVEQCSNLGLNFYIPKYKKCVESCDSNEYYIKDHNCYEKCPSNENFINSNDLTCSSTCPTFHRKISNDSPVSFCIASCEPEEYILGNECLSKCPNDFNKIGKDKKCKNVCESEDGLYKKKVDDSSEYNIYECISSCSAENGIYKIESDKECFTSCPTTHNKLLPGENDCLPICPPSKPFNIDPPDSNGHIICYSEDECKQNNKFYVDLNNKCVADCTGYTYKELISDGFYRCKNQCTNYIFRKESITGETFDHCVSYCPESENYIDDKTCKKQSEIGSSLYYEFDIKDNYSIYKLTSSCSGEFYLSGYGTDKQCYKECPTNFYLSPNENKCYEHCIDSTQYPFTVKRIINSVEKQICSEQCNNDEPNYESDTKICKLGCNLDGKLVIDHNNECVENCDRTTLFKFNLNGKCVIECSGQKLKYNDDFICREKCVLPKNCITQTNECKENCNSNEYKMPVYINEVATNEYLCVPNCTGKYFYSSDKICLNNCISGDYAIQDTLECVPDCDRQIPGEETGKNYHHYEGNSYPFKTCVKE